MLEKDLRRTGQDQSCSPTPCRICGSTAILKGLMVAVPGELHGKSLIKVEFALCAGAESPFVYL